MSHASKIQTTTLLSVSSAVFRVPQYPQLLGQQSFRGVVNVWDIFWIYNLKISAVITVICHRDGPQEKSCEVVSKSLNTALFFYPRDALHSAVFTVVRCLSVCPSHAGIVSKQLNLS